MRISHSPRLMEIWSTFKKVIWTVTLVQEVRCLWVLCRLYHSSRVINYLRKWTISYLPLHYLWNSAFHWSADGCGRMNWTLKCLNEGKKLKDQSLSIPHSWTLCSSVFCYFPPLKRPLACIDDTKKTFLSIGTREWRAEVKEKTGNVKLWG